MRSGTKFIPDDLFLLFRHHFPPVLEEVFVEDLLGGVVVVQHLPVEGRHLLSLLSQLHHLVTKDRSQWGGNGAGLFFGRSRFLDSIPAPTFRLFTKHRHFEI